MGTMKYFITIEDIDNRFDEDEYIFTDRIPNINESIIFNNGDLYTITNIIYIQNENTEFGPSKIIVKKGI